MQKQALSPGRILVTVLFALSCFSLLLFLWLSFGGSIPFKPKGFRFQVSFPQATQLALQADVRVAGVSVGKVVDKSLDSAGNRTLATVELGSQYVPIHRDARAILRQKTLLGETYVELTTGSKKVPQIADNGRLSNGQVAPQVQFDEVLNTFDPGTRQAFRAWQQNLAKASGGRAQDISDFLGNLPTFATDATSVLGVLDEQRNNVRGLLRGSATTFAALRQGQLQNLIRNAAQTFDATASQNRALAETFKIFPTFLDESKSTLTTLKTFALNTDPLVKDLTPVARDLTPTLRAVKALSPDLRRFFINLGPLIDVSRTGLPALSKTLRGFRPLLAQLGPFTEQLNPILDWLGLYNHQVADFIGSGASGLANTVPAPGAVGHYLRQFNPEGSEDTLTRTRIATNRGNTYLPPLGLGPDTQRHLIFPNFDCKPSGGPKPPTPGQTGSPACFIAPNINFQGRQQGRFPHVNQSHYRRGR